MSARIPPLPPPYSERAADILRRMMPGEQEPIALFRTYARNLPLAEAMHGWGGYELSRRLSLGLRDREILIDRTCARCGCEYEWGVHITFFAERAELTHEQIASLAHGTSTDPCWTGERDRLLLDAADTLHDENDIDGALWARLAAEFTEEQLLDLVMLCGWYHAISFTARAMRLPLERTAARFESYGGAPTALIVRSGSN